MTDPTAAKSRSTGGARRHLAIALDVPTLAEAVWIAGEVRDHIATAKVGLQLYSAHGPGAVAAIIPTGLDVLLDLKLHDIPNTVGAAARELGRLGVRYVTCHAAGGGAMLRAAVEGLSQGADDAGHPPPTVLAVTVLTSDIDAPVETLADRAATAAAAGCGVVCAVPDLPTVRAAAPGVFALTPGIRLAGGDIHDQARVSTPASAIAAGSDLLVIGRAVTAVDDHRGAAALINAEVAAQLAVTA